VRRDRKIRGDVAENSGLDPRRLPTASHFTWAVPLFVAVVDFGTVAARVQCVDGTNV
jgi:hypothetical protein